MWERILGHKQQLALLQKTLAENIFPHASLFAGPRGVGKFLTATITASALFCMQETKPCGTCLACRKIAEKNHPDVFFLVAENETVKIDQIRTLTSSLHYHPLEGEYKLVLIDDADCMTEGAANALLKTLEEPPPNTHFILVSAHPHRVLPTIRSRCQRVSFQPLSPSIIEQFLQETQNYNSEEAKRIARLSQGSLGLALQLTPPLIADTLDRFAFLVHQGNAADVMATSEEWSRAEEKTPLLLEILSLWYHEQFLLHPERRKYEVGFFHIHRAKRALETTANKQLLFEQLLFSLTTL